MTHYPHAIVWIDHHQAKVFLFNLAEVAAGKVFPGDRHVHVHHKANTVGSGHAPVDRAYLKKVLDQIADAGAILIAGPGSAKDEFVTYVDSQSPEVSARIAAVKTADHPSDRELVAFARKFFKTNDRIRA